MQEQQTEAAWDARQHFPTQIVLRISLYLDTRLGEFDKKLETLDDLHQLVRAWYDDKVDLQVEKNLRLAESLIYPLKATEQQKLQFKKNAAQLIREIFNVIMKEIRKRGLLIPEKEFIDEIDEIEKSY